MKDTIILGLISLIFLAMTLPVLANDPPVNTVPAPQIIDEDGILVVRFQINIAFDL